VYLDVFLEFSKQSEKYDCEACRKMFANHTLMKGGLTLGSIFHWQI